MCSRLKRTLKAEITGYDVKVDELTENNTTWRYFKIKIFVFALCVIAVYIENLIKIVATESTESKH